MMNVSMSNVFRFTSISGVLSAAYREACQQIGLLEDDHHRNYTLSEATVSAPATQIRTLFAIIKRGT